MKPKFKDITLLKLDHPGANDFTYRRRREFIASQLKKFSGEISPRIKYTQQEEKTWRCVTKKLSVLHAQWACHEYLEAKRRLAISPTKIPQFTDLNKKLFLETGFRLEAVAGLVDSKNFLGKLGERIMLSTQYVRHHSRPDYTPEPDVIHELIGHAPLLMSKEFADFSERIGKAAQKATRKQVKMLERLYWFTVEFGLIKEGGNIKAFGSGLLSSFGELGNAFSGKPKLKPFNVKTILETDYTYSQMQDVLFVIPSLKALKQKMGEFLEEIEL